MGDFHLVVNDTDRVRFVTNDDVGQATLHEPVSVKSLFKFANRVNELKSEKLNKKRAAATDRSRKYRKNRKERVEKTKDQTRSV